MEVSRRIVFVKEQLIEFLKPIADGIASTYGDRCEVLIHDFDNPEHSIVYIVGNVTGRKVGGSVSKIGLEAIQGGDQQEDLINYVHNTRDGKTLRSSTLMLRDSTGHVIGCLCINLDITDFINFQDFINYIFTNNGQKDGQVEPMPVHFTDQIDEVLDEILNTVIEEIPTPGSLMKRKERLAFISAMERRGAFKVRKAVPTIAEYLGVSRPTVYQYLKEVRENSQFSNKE